MQPLTKLLTVKKSHRIGKSLEQKKNLVQNLNKKNEDAFLLQKPNINSLDEKLQNVNEIKSQVNVITLSEEELEKKSKIENWNLPQNIVNWYKNRNIHNLFRWQVECLSIPNVLEGDNLIFSAPTSAGKTMVTDILMINQFMKRGKKTLIILPFVSVSREKMLSLQSMTRNTLIQVGGFMGPNNHLGGLASVDIAVCTIEKANNFVNRLIEQNMLDTIGTLIIDELHMLGDTSRGYLLELLLTKVCYLSKLKGLTIQILGMSATLPNLNDIAKWIEAKLYVTSFRPVPFIERIKIGDEILTAPDLIESRKVTNNGLTIKINDPILNLALETVLEGNGVLIFCPSKSKCEELAKKLASFFNLLIYKSEKEKEQAVVKEKLIKIILNENPKQLLDQLSRTSASLEVLFEKIIPYGIAFHHAGLSQDERDIVEDGFRRGMLKVLVATSTLSSGVNLPARRVIVSSPKFYNQTMDILTYKQMVGRAGRKGIDLEGESILICADDQKEDGKFLIQSGLKKIESNLSFDIINNNQELILTDTLKRAVLEVIASGISSTFEEVKNYLNFTFYSLNHHLKDELIQEVINYLKNFKFIYYDSNQVKYISTKLGKAVFTSSIAPDDALYFVKELEKARKAFVLQNDLHIIFEVTLPLSCRTSIDWKRYFDIWNELDLDSQHVGHIVGIDPRFIQKRSFQDSQCKDIRLKTHIRFYYSLALNDLVKEMPLKKVSEKYNLSKGELQQMQLMSSTFAGIISIFCQKLGYSNLELIISQYQDRLQFGVQRELIDLMRISCLNAQLARDLYKADFNTVIKLAHSNIETLANVLKESTPFSMQNNSDQNRKIWISGQCRAMDDKEIAEMIIAEARNLIEKDVGNKISWVDDDESNNWITQELKDVSSLCSIFGQSKQRLKSQRKKPKKIITGKLKGKKTSFNKSLFSKKSRHLKKQKLKKASIELSNVLSNVLSNEKPLSLQSTKLLPNEYNHINEFEKNDLKNEVNDAPRSIKRTQSPSSQQKETNAVKLKKIDSCVKPLFSDHKDNNNKEFDANENDASGDDDNCDSNELDDNGNSHDEQVVSKNIFEYISCNRLKLLEIKNESHISSIIDSLKLYSSMCILFNLKRIKSFSSNYLEEGALKKTEIVSSGIKFSYNKIYNLQEISISFGLTEVYQILNPFAMSLFKAELKSTLKNLKVKLIIYNQNSSYKVFRKYFEMRREDLDNITWFDLKSAAWLLNPDSEEPENCSSLIKNILKNEILIDVDSKLLEDYSLCWSAYYSYLTLKKLENLLLKHSLSKVFNECEMKVLIIISEMELNGIGVDIVYLKKSINNWVNLKERVYLEACKLAGKDFNPDSPKQISNILYRDLNLLSYCEFLSAQTKSTNRKKIPEHFKTSKRMLDKLKQFHPFPALIIYLRKLTFLLESAYSVLANVMKVEKFKMERVSGISNHWTSTGRILMHNPNLLSISRDFSFSFQNENFDISLRKAFKARDGYFLISADYSHLELRILAHFSKDSLLLNALNQEEDVFECIARQLNDVKNQKISEDERRKAKETCYAIIYGMSTKELSKNLNIEEKKAKIFKSNFFKTFFGLANFIEECKKKCRKNMYVETLHRRKRYIPLIESKNLNERAKSERQAVNTIIQGSASDIIKLAMIKTDREIKIRNLKAHLVLQLHDELIFEVEESNVDYFSKLLSKCMESCVKRLTVKMPVKIKKGLRWNQMEQLSMN